MQYNKNNLSLLRNRIPLAEQVEGSEQLQSTIDKTMISPPTRRQKKSAFHPTG